MIRRTKQEIEQDREQVKELILKNKTPQEIALETGIPLSLVISDINVISKRWQGTKVDSDVAKAAQLEKLNLMERELWAAWESSRIQARKSTLTATTSKGIRTEETIDENPGDMKYMELIMKIIQERNKMLGLYEAVKTSAEVTVKRDNAAVREEVLKIIEDARERALKNRNIIDTIETTQGNFIPVQIPEKVDIA